MSPHRIVDRGYKEINMNVGCPSEKGQSVCTYGAALMANPSLVGECIRSMAQAVPAHIPCTVKCRIGSGVLSIAQTISLVRLFCPSRGQTHRQRCCVHCAGERVMLSQAPPVSQFVSSCYRWCIGGIVHSAWHWCYHAFCVRLVLTFILCYASVIVHFTLHWCCCSFYVTLVISSIQCDAGLRGCRHRTHGRL